MSLYLTKSDFKVARHCATKLYYRKQGYPTILDEDPYLEQLAVGGFMIEEIARQLYPVGRQVRFSAGNERALQETEAALRADPNPTLFEPSFAFEGLLARVDIFVKNGSTIDLIEVKAKSWDSSKNPTGTEGLLTRRGHPRVRKKWEDYVADVAFQTYVLQRRFPNCTIRPFLMLPDKAKRTVEGLTHDLFRLERVSHPRSGQTTYEVKFDGDASLLREVHFLTLVDAGNAVELLMPTVESEIERLRGFIRPSLVRVQEPIGLRCRDCEYRGVGGDADGFGECWGELAAPTPHILDLYRPNAANTVLLEEHIGRGTTALVAIDDACLASGTSSSWNARQKVQLSCARSGEEWFGATLAKDLREAVYPLHFIDFETTTLAVPLHAGMRPFELVAYQWSCHTIDSPGAAPRHSEWIQLDSGFPNFQFAEALFSAFGTGGTPLMWSAHERTTLKTILRQAKRRGYENPDVVSWLRHLTTPPAEAGPGLLDMHRICEDGYCHPKMGPSTSIKDVLQAVWQEAEWLRDLFPEYRFDPVSPYKALAPVVLGESTYDVSDGTAAIRAYEAMMFGLESRQPEARGALRTALLEYCKLDTAAMVMIWWYWEREA